MKNLNKISFLVLIFSLWSCSLTRMERKITNDLITEKFESSSYKPNLFKKNILIREAGNGLGALLFYEQVFSDTTQINYKYQYWPLNKTQIQEEKKRKLKNHSWRNPDIDVYDFTIIESNKNVANYKSGYYLNLPDEFLVFTISKPFIINKNEAIVWYGVTHKLGETFDRCVILMKKSESKKWKIKSIYYDENSSW